MSRSRIAARLVWLAVFSIAVLATDQNRDRLFGLFSFSSFFVAAAAVVSAFKSGSEWQRDTRQDGIAGSESAPEPTARVGWSWMRLAYAFEVMSVGLVIWFATAFVVGGAVYLASGAGISWLAGVLVVGITSPVAVPWPVKRWPTPEASGFTHVPPTVKRRFVAGVLSTPSVLVLAVTIDRLVSGFSALSPARQLAGIVVIAFVVASSVGLGRYLPPPASTGQEIGLMDIRRQLEPVGPYSADHRYARAIVSFEVACSGAVILLTTLALVELIGARFEDDGEAFFVVTTLRATGAFGALLWALWRWPAPKNPTNPA